MTLTRIAARIAKSLWSSVPPRCSGMFQNMSAPMRTITSGQDHIKLGVFTHKIEEPKQDISLLDPLLGMWFETSRENLSEFLQNSGVQNSTIQGYERYTTWISFVRKKEDWTFSYGFQESNFNRIVEFKLGQKVPAFYIDGSKAKTCFEQVGTVLRERQKTKRKPTRIVLTVRSVDENDQLTAISTINDVSMTRYYSRRVPA